jgi:hypothetical protein
MVKRGQGTTPRAHAGGYSERYEERRRSRGSVRQYAGAWTDAAASTLLAALHEDSRKHGRRIVEHTRELLLNRARMEALIKKAAAGSGMSTPDERLALEQTAFYAGGVTAAMREGGQGAADKRVRAFLKPLRERRVSDGDCEELVVEMSGPPASGLRSLLSARPEADFGRSIEKNLRILDGLRAWYPRWLLAPGVVWAAVERAWRSRPMWS